MKMICNNYNEKDCNGDCEHFGIHDEVFNCKMSMTCNYQQLCVCSEYKHLTFKEDIRKILETI